MHSGHFYGKAETLTPLTARSPSEDSGLSPAVGSRRFQNSFSCVSTRVLGRQCDALGRASPSCQGAAVTLGAVHRFRLPFPLLQRRSSSSSGPQGWCARPRWVVAGAQPCRGPSSFPRSQLCCPGLHWGASESSAQGWIPGEAWPPSSCPQFSATSTPIPSPSD